MTRMPRDAYSMASDRVAAARPPLVRAARTDGLPDSAWSAMVALMLTTCPRPRRSISATASWVSQKNPARFTPVISA